MSSVQPFVQHRQGGVSPMATNPPDAFVLSRNLDHPHLKGRFKLRLWVPTEQVGLVIGKSGKTVLGIKRDSGIKSINNPVC
ncbi:unnamed protein product [Choristocarpus tenellus]